jgi:hypothetical protein
MRRKRPQILRRSRGYAPRAIRLPWPVPGHVLATGPHLKNTFALAKGFDCFLGPHVGDLENLETFRAFEEDPPLRRFFEIRPGYGPFPPDHRAAATPSRSMEEFVSPASRGARRPVMGRTSGCPVSDCADGPLATTTIWEASSSS